MNKFKKIVFLEGLPNVGKTSIANYIKINFKNILVSDEIINPKILNNSSSITQNDYLENDIMKFNRSTCNNDILLVDRGFISTYCYNIAKSIIQEDYSNIDVIKKINKMFNCYNQDNVIVLYLKSENISLPYVDDFDPYGSVDNQKFLQELTLFVCNKYVKNLRIIDYNYLNNFEEVIHEIIN